MIWVSLQFGTEHGYVLEGFLTSCSFDYLNRSPISRSLTLVMIVGSCLAPLLAFIVFFILSKKALQERKTEMIGLVINLVKKEQSTTIKKQTEIESTTLHRLNV